MRKRTKAALILVIIAAVLVASASFKMYYVRPYSGGQIFWNVDEAYLFIGGSYDGVHFPLVEYPWVMLREYLRTPVPPDDERVSETVIRVTPSRVERHVVVEQGAANFPIFLTPFEQSFYAQCPGDVLCKWTDTGFQLATDEERQRLGGTNGLIRDVNVQAINGWFRRSIPYLPNDQFAVEVSTKFTLLLKNRNPDKHGYPNVSIDLLRPGQAVETISHVDATPRRVSKEEYERRIGKSPIQ